MSQIQAQLLRPNYFNVDEKELLTLWVADKVLDAIEDEEELKSDAIKVAQSSL